MQSKIEEIENKLMESVQLFRSTVERLQDPNKSSDPLGPTQKLSSKISEINRGMHALIDLVGIPDERMANLTKTPLEDAKYIEEAYKRELVRGAVQSYSQREEGE